MPRITSPDAPWSFAALGVCCDPITATIGAISAFAAANAGVIGTVGTVASLAGAGISAMGTLAAGDMAKKSADFQAAQMRQQGTQAIASSQRTMFETQRKTDQVQSQLQSRAAASGAGAQDPTVIKLGSDIAGRGEQQALTDLYNGENIAAGLNDSARAKEISGQAAKTGSYYSAAGTIASGIGQGFSKYAGRNPYALPSSNQPTDITNGYG